MAAMIQDKGLRDRLQAARAATGAERFVKKPHTHQGTIRQVQDRFG